MPFCNRFSKNAIEERITAIMKIKKASTLAISVSMSLIIGITTAFVTLAATNTENETTNYIRNFSDIENENRIQNTNVSVNNIRKLTAQYKTIDIKQFSLQAGSYKEYGRYSFKKGDIRSVDIS